ncbi:hypothetical protein VDG1235_141 [Verrucomicrobiia bacterium DG1235]|nr:hypothetical protein VDG1235_141 [Verrucomicrobiae bacterium DG1235]
MKTSRILAYVIAFSALASTAAALTKPVIPAQPVPDSGATIALLGLAVAGLIAARRRFSK